jgi:hypothetical protein
MNARQLQRLAVRYLGMLPGAAIRPDGGTLGVTGPPNCTAIGHVKWLCEEIILDLDEPSDAALEEARQLISFIQGVLWAFGVRSINQLQEDVRDVQGM